MYSNSQLAAMRSFSVKAVRDRRFPGQDGFTSGLGIFDGGFLAPSTWGITEWLIVGGGALLVLGGGLFGSSKAARRRKLKVI